MDVLVARGAFTPYRVSVVRDAAAWIGGCVVVFGIFFLIVWLAP